MSNISSKTDKLPSPLTDFSQISQKLSGKKPVLFLDYDGTLSPIIDNPEKAFLPVETKDIIQQLAMHCTVIVVSGRDRADVKEKVGLEELHYAGSHGYDITGPNNLKMELEAAKDIQPLFDSFDNELKKRFAGLENIKVERKRYAIAVHYRNASEDAITKAKSIIDGLVDSEERLKTGGGKEIVEIKPNIDWHKGKAVLWLMEKLQVNSKEYLPFYFGDDLTDEDAFKELKDRGICVLVGSHSGNTYANYKVQNEAEVKLTLEKILEMLKGS